MIALSPEPPPNEIKDSTAFFAATRRAFHEALLSRVLFTNEKGVPANADGGSRASVAIAKGIMSRLGEEIQGERLAGQMSGREFEEIVCSFVDETFRQLAHLRPGVWKVEQITARNQAILARFEQYAHLAALSRAASKDPELKTALGNDYTIAPDIVIIRNLESDASINAPRELVDESVSRHASLRESNGGSAHSSCQHFMQMDHAERSSTERTL